MTDIGPPATPAWRLDVPPRLVIVPDVTAIVEENYWVERVIHHMLRWTDISTVTADWHGIAIVAPRLSWQSLARPSFVEAWKAWADHTRIRVVLRNATDKDDDSIIILGPAGAAATISFFCRDFFTDRTPVKAWKSLFKQMLPGCTPNLDGRFQLEGWLTNGQITAADDSLIHDIVVLRNQTQSIYHLPAHQKALRAAC